MQSVRYYFILLGLFSLWPQPTESLKFWQIPAPIEIKVQKNSPPYQAFVQVREQRIPAANIQTASYRTQVLTVEQAQQPNVQSYRKVVILEPILIKNFQAPPAASIVVESRQDLSWMASLPLRQRVRLEAAQARYSILDSPVGAAPAARALAQDPPDRIAVTKTTSGYKISGPIEIAGGLALTDEHFIELRRSVEGLPREAGDISLKEGTYDIEIDSLNGNLIAKMYDKSGDTLGLGSLRLEADFLSSGLAPKLVIRPHISSLGGTVYDPYNSKSDKSPADLRAAALNDESLFEHKPDSSHDHKWTAANFQGGSTTVARFAASEFVSTNSITVAGKGFTSPIFPKGMISAFKEIVSEQRMQNLNDPQLPVIWGQVLLDGKPLSGVQVELEGFDGIKTIYFDALSLPDTRQTESSANGYFAIIGAPEGFHALIAKRGAQYFSHNVVVVEAATVSYVTLESTIRTRNVPLRIFDSFTGAPRAAEVEMQSAEAPLHVSEEGWLPVLLPQISRHSLMQVFPGAGYVAARYFYQDDQDYLHVPLVSSEWLGNLLRPSAERVDLDLGVVIGFFQAETFEVYLAGLPDFSKGNIFYFDAQGQPTDQGLKGGGFVIANLEPGTHEVVILGKETEKIYSRLLPVDQRSISVLTFPEL